MIEPEPPAAEPEAVEPASSEPKSEAARKRDAAHRTADGVFKAWEKRTALVKNEMAAESAANDAKTIRLKALRLEKEAQDAEEALRNPAPKPAPKKRAAKR